MNKKISVLPLIIALFLSATGVLLIYTLWDKGVSTIVLERNWKTQLVAVLIGCAGYAAIRLIRLEYLAKHWYFYTLPVLLLTLLTFTPLGLQVAGTDDKAWLDLGRFSLQPAELMKVAFVMTFAFHLESLKQRDADINKPLNTLLLCIHALIPMAIVVLQGDYGTALIFAIMFIIMFFASGVSWKYIAALSIFIPLLGVVAWNTILNADQKARFSVVFALEENAEGYGYQQLLSRDALVAGGAFGHGLNADSYVYVPEIQNDFILSFVAQCFGGVGLIIAFLLFCAILLILLWQAHLQTTPLRRTILLGVFAMLFSHGFLNAGMILGVLPVIGIPFPFLSGGGSSMIAMLCALGIAASAAAPEKPKKTPKLKVNNEL